MNVIVHQKYQGHNQTLIDCSWAVAFQTDNDSNLAYLKKTNALKVIIETMENQTIDNALIPLLRIVGNATTGEDVLVDIMLSNRILDVFDELIEKNKQRNNVKR